MKFSALWGIFASPLLGLVTKPLHSCSGSPRKELRNQRDHQGLRDPLTWSLPCRRRCKPLRVAALLLRVFSLALAIYWLNLRGCLGPQHPVKIGFAELGLPVSGQVRYRQGEFLHPTALSSWISDPGTTPSLRRRILCKSAASYWGIIEDLAKSNSISHSFPSEIEAQVYFVGAGVIDFEIRQ